MKRFLIITSYTVLKRTISTLIVVISGLWEIKIPAMACVQLSSRYKH
jgi:hypothetical protein